MIDHISFATHDLVATRAFYEQRLGFPVLIHEWMVMKEGGHVDHLFFDCGGGCALAFMQWCDVPGVPRDFDTSINRGLGVPNGTFHFAFRCVDARALARRRDELIARGVVVGDLLDLSPYRSFFFDDPVNGLRLEYSTRIGQLSDADRDPTHRRIPADLALFEQASRPRADQSRNPLAQINGAMPSSPIRERNCRTRSFTRAICSPLRSATA